MRPPTAAHARAMRHSRNGCVPTAARMSGTRCSSRKSNETTLVALVIRLSASDGRPSHAVVVVDGERVEVHIAPKRDLTRSSLSWRGISGRCDRCGGCSPGETAAFRPLAAWRPARVEVSYLTPSEFAVISRLQRWRPVRPLPDGDRLWRALNRWQLPFQFTTLLFIYYKRGMEDVEGLFGHHMDSTVAVISRETVNLMGRTIGNFHGTVLPSEGALLEWSRVHVPSLYADLVRGLFVAPENMDAHIGWLRDFSARVDDLLGEHWLFRCVVALSAHWIPNDLTPTTRTSLPDAAYRPRPAPVTPEALSSVFQEYVTSTDELLSRFPLPPDAVVRLGGSLAEGASLPVRHRPGRPHPRASRDHAVQHRVRHARALRNRAGTNAERQSDRGGVPDRPRPRGAEGAAGRVPARARDGASGAGAVDGELARAAVVRAGPSAGGRNHASAAGAAGADREDGAPDSSPRFHPRRFQGLLGPRAAGRSAVIPRGSDAVDEATPGAGRSEGRGPRAEPSPGSLGTPGERSSGAVRRRRVFALDVFPCPRGGRRRRIVGVHTGGERLRVLLERLGLVSASPSPAASRSPPRRGA